MSSDPSFRIPQRPSRRYPRRGGVEYEGETVFELTPAGDHGDDALDAALRGVLDSDGYTYGDWFDLPMPLYLVHDERTGDVFRAAVRDGSVELHVLPATDADGLRRLYDRLTDTVDCEWHVVCETG